MLDPKLLDDISARMGALLANTPAADIERNLRAVLTAQLAKLDLVTRADFDVLKAQLLRAQERLAALEKSLADRADRV
jgi:BMFP domain-containing protein YqiC